MVLESFMTLWTTLAERESLLAACLRKSLALVSSSMYSWMPLASRCALATIDVFSYLFCWVYRAWRTCSLISRLDGQLVFLSRTLSRCSRGTSMIMSILSNNGHETLD